MSASQTREEEPSGNSLEVKEACSGNGERVRVGVTGCGEDMIQCGLGWVTGNELCGTVSSRGERWQDGGMGGSCLHPLPVDNTPSSPSRVKCKEW